MKKLWDLKKVLSNLEAEGQGRGIIMGVTRLLLLEPFMYWNQQTADYSTHHCIPNQNFSKNVQAEAEQIICF